MDLLIPSKQENFTDYIHYYFFSDCRGIDQNLNGEMLRAVRQDDKEKIETLIENCGDVNAASSTLGNTVLIYSAQSGNEEIVNLLIEKGGLISESFSILQNMCQITILSTIYPKKRCSGYDLPHVLIDEAKLSEKLSEIKPHL